MTKASQIERKRQHYTTQSVRLETVPPLCRNLQLPVQSHLNLLSSIETHVVSNLTFELKSKEKPFNDPFNTIIILQRYYQTLLLYTENNNVITKK